jgi:hypothetical protein
MKLIDDNLLSSIAGGEPRGRMTGDGDGRQLDGTDIAKSRGSYDPNPRYASATVEYKDGSTTHYDGNGSSNTYFPAPRPGR